MDQLLDLSKPHRDPSYLTTVIKYLDRLHTGQQNVDLDRFSKKIYIFPPKHQTIVAKPKQYLNLDLSKLINSVDILSDKFSKTHNAPENSIRTTFTDRSPDQSTEAIKIRKKGIK